MKNILLVISCFLCSSVFASITFLEVLEALDSAPAANTTKVDNGKRPIIGARYILPAIDFVKKNNANPKYSPNEDEKLAILVTVGAFKDANDAKNLSPHPKDAKLRVLNENKNVSYNADAISLGAFDNASNSVKVLAMKDIDVALRNLGAGSSAGSLEFYLHSPNAKRNIGQCPPLFQVAKLLATVLPKIEGPNYPQIMDALVGNVVKDNWYVTNAEPRGFGLSTTFSKNVNFRESLSNKANNSCVYDASYVPDAEQHANSTIRLYLKKK